MIENIKKVRKLQRLKSAYSKLKKKLCRRCLKKIAWSMLTNKEIQDLDFCDECDPLTKKVLLLQAEIGEEGNKEIVQTYNNREEGKK